MELPTALKLSLEDHLSGLNTSGLQETANTISERYRSQSGQGKKLVSKDIEALAYSLVRMPATYSAVFSALEYALEFGDVSIGTLLDVGAGTGAATWAADALCGLREITCIEQDESMIRLGQALMKSGSESLKNAAWRCLNLNDDEPALPEADLVISSYVLNEMTGINRLKAAEKLFDAANEILLIVEPGTPVCYRQLMEIRDALIKKGARVVAPCTHDKACPLAEDDWCHFTCRVARSRIHRQLKSGDAPYEDEKFAYLALSKADKNRAEARLLRHPQVRKGHIMGKVCDPAGVREITFTKKNKELYAQIRRAKCGDSLPGLSGAQGQPGIL